MLSMDFVHVPVSHRGITLILVGMFAIQLACLLDVYLLVD